MHEQKLLKRKRKATFDGNKNALAAICIDLAELYRKEARYENAIDEYSTVAGVYKDMGKDLDYARANRMIGEAYLQLRQYNKALQHQQIHLKTAKEQNDQLEEQRALATIGHTYLTKYLDGADKSEKECLQFAHKWLTKSLAVCDTLTGISKAEHKDMTARLLSNLGVVQECLGNFDRGIELIQKSINICKANDLYEQLDRGYTSLGALYLRKKEYNNAMNQYNLALETEERLKNITLMCATLQSKADVLITLADFQAAKRVLVKAYKLNHPTPAERESIENNLKVVAAMCLAEESLLTTSSTDYKTQKGLYEKLGDGACRLKNYFTAIKYYEKMLEAAESNGESGVDLSPCYISLAETYRDDKQFDKAISFFRKEYEISKGNAKESVPTLLNIADCMEDANRDLKEIEDIYLQARGDCKLSGEKRLECKVLVRYVVMLKKKGKFSQAAQVELEINNMDFVNLDSDGEVTEQATPDIGYDINIKDLIDISDESDSETKAFQSRTVRKRTRGLVLKKNSKGESQLHTACINGNAALVKHLLNQGHPVNVRDHCGWLPIHEACIYGRVEIVRMLIEKGALINDRGHTLCEGTTPLHDAALNGHLEVIQLLLDSGASTVAKNDRGETPLHILKTWGDRTELTPEMHTLYNNLIHRLTQDLEKLGHSNDIVMQNERSTAVVLEQDDELPTQTNRRKSRDIERPVKKRDTESKIGNLRRNISFDEDVDASTSRTENKKRNSKSSDSDDGYNSITNQEANARDEYKRVMESLRHPQREESVEKKRKSNESFKPAHVTMDDSCDDWLVDDLAQNQHKRQKTLSANSLVNSMGTRKKSSGSLGRHNSSSSNKSRSFTEDAEMDGLPEADFDFPDVEVQEQPAFTIENSDSDNEHQSAHLGVSRKRKTQSSLLDSGFTRHRSFSPTNIVLSGQSGSVKRKHQTKLTTYAQHRSPRKGEASHISDTQLSNIFNSEPTFSVDVRIDGKLYRVPILATEIHTRTIKWLAEEASKRYSRKECMKPTLELETTNGAVLADDDFISILFAAGSVQAEEVHAKIVRWNLPPLSERYLEACTNTKTNPQENTLKVLQETSSFLSVQDFSLGSKNMAPLCKAINRQINLHHLNLSGNFMKDESVQLLCLSLPSLDNLTVLNLSLNHITSESLRYFSDMFVGSSKNLLENLESLDLSYNPLGDEGLKYLSIITCYLKLRSLNLISVNFTSDIFDVASNRNVDLCLDYVLNFDISYNQLGKQQIKTFLAWLKPQTVETLNVSNNVTNEKELVKDITNWLSTAGNAKLNLRTLNLARCCITDAEISNLISALLLADKLQSLNLSYNRDLTSISLRRLMQHHPPVNAIDLRGCENIFKYFESCSENTWNFVKLRNFKFSFKKEHSRDRNVLVDMWRSAHGEKSKVVDVLLGFIELSVSD